MGQESKGRPRRRASSSRQWTSAQVLRWATRPDDLWEPCAMAPWCCDDAERAIGPWGKACNNVAAIHSSGPPEHHSAAVTSGSKPRCQQCRTGSGCSRGIARPGRWWRISSCHDNDFVAAVPCLGRPPDATDGQELAADSSPGVPDGRRDPGTCGHPRKNRIAAVVREKQQLAQRQSIGRQSRKPPSPTRQILPAQAMVRPEGAEAGVGRRSVAVPGVVNR